MVALVVEIAAREKMPPEVSHCHSSVNSLPQFFPPPLSESKLDRSLNPKCCRSSERMKITKRKLVLLLVFILASLSVLRLLRIAIKTTSFSSLPVPIYSSNSTCMKTRSTRQNEASTKAPPALTEKEFRYLSNIISQKAPCNVLIFGLHPQYLGLSSINAGGFMLILEDNPEKMNTFRTSIKSTRIYKVEYQIPAREAYKVLKQARQNPSCSLGSGPLEASSCQLAMTNLPREVHELEWDVVVVDGPGGDRPDAPGRMSTIYTARMIARSGNTTHVVVHDVNRMIEEWFSWEFLCVENLLSSKGKFWDFEIMAQSNSTSFCPSKTTPTMQLM